MTMSLTKDELRLLCTSTNTQESSQSVPSAEGMVDALIDNRKVPSPSLQLHLRTETKLARYLGQVMQLAALLACLGRARQNFLT